MPLVELMEVPLEALVNRALIVRKTVLLLAYVMEIGNQIGREEALNILASVDEKFSQRWAQENISKLNIKGDDAKAGWALDQAYWRAMTPGPWRPEEHIVVEDRPERVVVRHTGWCPMLEACKMLNLSTREVCPIFPARNANAILRTLNPRLSLRIGKMRPEASYCEEIIELSE